MSDDLRELGWDTGWADAFAPFQGEAFECTGEEVYDLTDATAINAAFFTEGPGYGAKNM